MTRYIEPDSNMTYLFELLNEAQFKISKICADEGLDSNLSLRLTGVLEDLQVAIMMRI